MAQPLQDTARLKALEGRLRQDAPDLVTMFLRCAQGAVLHADEHILIANEAAATLLGAPSASSLAGLAAATVLDTRGTAVARARMAQVVANDGPPSVALYTVRRLDGRVAEVEMSTVAYPRPIDGAQVMMTLLHDVTERRRASDAEARFEQLFESSPDPILVVDLAGRVLLSNAVAHELLGYTADEMRALHVEDLVPSPWREDHAAKRAGFARTPARRLMSGQRPMSVAARDGRVIPVEIGLGPTTLAGQEAVIVTMRDLSERVKAEEALRQATRLDTVGRLAGGVAHDFNNLLTVILALAEELEGQLREEPEALSLVREIGYAGGRAADLTRQLLTFARRQPNNPRTIDLNEVVRSFARLLGRTLGGGVKLRLDLAPGALKVRLDPVHVEQVLLNLAVNARDAMPDGGQLTVRTYAVERDDPRASLVCLDVADTGCGMSDDAIQHVFEPFFTTKRAGAGTGLGLATVYGIVKQGNGDIAVTSRPGEGTSFHITFPASFARVEKGSLMPAPKRRGRETVLVVEDDPTVRQVTARLLRGAGYEVLLAASLAEAVDAARDAASLHLLVTDVVMPNDDGVRVAEALRRTHPTLPVLFVSGYAQNVEALAHFGRLLAKPFTTDALLGAVRDALDVG